MKILGWIMVSPLILACAFPIVMLVYSVCVIAPWWILLSIVGLAIVSGVGWGIVENS